MGRETKTTFAALNVPKIIGASRRTLVPDETNYPTVPPWKSSRNPVWRWENVLMQAGSCVCVLLDFNFTGADAY